ncbi:uncharacterized protein FTJAE_8504 [Fusarium tjaetaba]|uniref:Uncharacterized protein n=1 Tax=Fusarium tjaetaba TaxID=1567544 RepID=A0A8H5RB37_9HYPO|nr:uncharacterized protein FTJAE_8504 [Fusarium tjaetaba]KAF5629623.1 hypothetical protein FTJAE_8504 [Fusarium tjaetaba]
MAPDAADSASAPSSSPAAPWSGPPKPKRLPKRKHYHSELAWIHAERARLAERLKVVDSLCKEDAESIDAFKDEIAPLRKRVEAHAEAPSSSLTPSLEEYVARGRRMVDEAKAAAAASKTEGPEPNSSNSTTITLFSLTYE